MNSASAALNRRTSVAIGLQFEVRFANKAAIRGRQRLLYGSGRGYMFQIRQQDELLNHFQNHFAQILHACALTEIIF